MRFSGVLLLSVLLVSGDAPSLFARQADPLSCGTSREDSQGRLFLHRQSARTRTKLLSAPAAAAVARDVGDIALIDDSDGVVSRLNQFDLDNMTLAFAPSAANAAQYRFSVTAGGYDGAATAGTPLALGDDDSKVITLPFGFPYFGAVYTRAYVNSDGNLTFTTGDSSSSARSVGRMASGLPRIAPLFDDLDPSKMDGGVRVLTESGRVVVSWVAVPEYSETVGAPQTFQLRLYPNGRIEFSYAGIKTDIANAVTGISPGSLKGPTTLVDFRNDASADYTGPVMELFANGQTIDLVAVAQKFYQTHEDAYDYLVIYNALGLPAMGNALAYEDTVRSRASGYGVEAKDVGAEYGSASRLQSVLNLGPVSQYNPDPLAKPWATRPGDTALSILAHEAGHLFLAYVSVPDPNNPASEPMLGYQGSHWSFLFNSEGSFLEGEEIMDGAGIRARFITRNIVSQYSPLDQYLMGFRAPVEVPPSFAVLNAVSPDNTPMDPNKHPASGVQFNGDRLDITPYQLIQANGRRTPDYTVAQRRFRFGFILIVPAGQTPSDAIAQIDRYRTDFPEYYATATERRAVAETTLRRSLKLSLFPAAGVFAGRDATATVSVQNAPAEDLTVLLSAPDGSATVPASVTIPAGATSASFKVTGVSPGVEELTATPQGQAYETAFAKVQVLAPAGARLYVASGGGQANTGANPLPNPVVVRLTDANNLPYPGARIAGTPSEGGSLAAGTVVTDADGRASFTWTPGAGASPQLSIALENAPTIAVTVGVRSGPAVTVVQNAASFTDGMAVGSFGTIWGAGLADGQTIVAPPDWPFALGGVTVRLNGTAVRLLYVSDNQINFYVPPDAALGTGVVTVTTPSGAEAGRNVTLSAVHPGIFSRAILKSGTYDRADTVPVAAGDYVSMYCNGLGPTQERDGLQWTSYIPTVLIGGVTAEVQYHGAAPGYVGLYQVNVKIPSGLASGQQSVTLTINGLQTNTETILVQ